MQGYTQQSKMHPGAMQAMNAGIGGLHKPMPKPPSIGGLPKPMQQAGAPMQQHMGGGPQLSPLAQALLAAKPHARRPMPMPNPQGAQIAQLLAMLRGGLR